MRSLGDTSSDSRVQYIPEIKIWGWDSGPERLVVASKNYNITVSLLVS